MLNAQLQVLGTDYADVGLAHWVPADPARTINESLERERRSGKARFVGFSACNIHDIRHVLCRTATDVIMLPFSVLEPDPFRATRDGIRVSGNGVLSRSCLKECFLTGRFPRDSTIDDPSDQGHRWIREQESFTADAAEEFRFLEGVADSMGIGSARDPIAYPEISTVTIRTRSERQAEINFSTVPGCRLPDDCLDAIHARQRRMRLFDRRGRFKDRVRSIFG